MAMKGVKRGDRMGYQPHLADDLRAVAAALNCGEGWLRDLIKGGQISLPLDQKTWGQLQMHLDMLDSNPAAFAREAMRHMSAASRERIKAAGIFDERWQREAYLFILRWKIMFPRKYLTWKRCNQEVCGHNGKQCYIKLTKAWFATVKKMVDNKVQYAERQKKTGNPGPMLAIMQALELKPNAGLDAYEAIKTKSTREKAKAIAKEERVKRFEEARAKKMKQYPQQLSLFAVEGSDEAEMFEEMVNMKRTYEARKGQK